jgi:hypothetical protein
MEKSMVRYGKLNSDRKDTLFTFRSEDKIFFGIARCNVKVGDVFDKELGRKIAQNRALKAQEVFKSGNVALESGNIEDMKEFIPYGGIPVADIKSLLNYFRSLQNTFKP